MAVMVVAYVSLNIFTIQWWIKCYAQGAIQMGAPIGINRLLKYVFYTTYIFCVTITHAPQLP